MLQAFYEKRKDKMDFIKIDADENKSLLKENNIQALPVLQLYKDGKVVWTHDGEIDEATLVKETGL
jgi:thioredoxin-like negative regulator of GroEL